LAQKYSNGEKCDLSPAIFQIAIIRRHLKTVRKAAYFTFWCTSFHL